MADVNTERDGDVLVVTLNRPEAMNAMSRSLLEGLSIASLRLVHQLCVHPSLRPPGLRVASDLGAIGLKSSDAAYRFNLGCGCRLRDARRGHDEPSPAAR